MRASLSDEIRRTIGPAAHNVLLREMGGKRVFIPKSMGPHHPLAETLGRDTALALAEKFGGETYEVPLTQRVREQIIADLKSNVPVGEIAQRYYCSRRTVFRIKAELHQPDTHEQGSLF